jgi:hypothetical protein
MESGMHKLTQSWMVPVSSFALAVVLAMVAGPKSKALGRDPGTGTGGDGCVCDVKNFSYFTQVLVDDITTGGTYDFQYGIPATKTNNTVGNTCNVRVTYQVTNAGGIVATRTLDVPLDATPKTFRVDAKDVEETKEIRVDWKGNAKDLDKALKGAKKALAGGEKWIGETATSRNPILYKFNLHGRTGQKRGGASCTDDMTFTVPTPIDPVSNTGIVTGLQP